ncbi:hypothetical protein Ndes2526B_g09360 [Nannochloris sp. 'desiccata']
MAGILGNYLRAREGAYFKMEQEASIQEHKNRLIKEGKLKSNESPSSSTTTSSFTNSEANYDTLPEVLAAQARVDAPNAAKRKAYELRAYKGAPEPLTDEERWRYRASASAVSAAVGHVPRLSLSGRNRYGIPSSQKAGDLALSTSSLRHRLSPEAAEVARRSYVAGVRALVYGSLLSVGLLAVGGTATAQYIGIGSGQDFREKLQSVMLPMKEGLIERVLPWKLKAEAWISAKDPNNQNCGNRGHNTKYWRVASSSKE